MIASVKRTAPDAIIHMALFNDLNLAYEQRHQAWQVMVDSSKHLAEAAAALEIPIILVSSDWVFDGTQALADEATPPNPSITMGFKGRW
ncbi:MAG: sugar nucleotide-binding protein [Deinococcales bacterium]